MTKRDDEKAGRTASALALLGNIAQTLDLAHLEKWLRKGEAEARRKKDEAMTAKCSRMLDLAEAGRLLARAFEETQKLAPKPKKQAGKAAQMGLPL